MRLFVVRHGKAERESRSGRDEDRELTELGRRQAEWLGRELAGDAPGSGWGGLILASPAARARETATIIHEELRLGVGAGASGRAPGRAAGGVLVIEPRLQVGVSASSLIEVIRGRASESSVMLVGHNPTLAELIWALARGLPAREVELRTGEAFVLEADPSRPIGTASIVGMMRLEE